MKDWKNLLRCEFAYMEAPLAVPPLDERRAGEIVYLSKVHKIPLKEILKEAEDYLASNGHNETLIKERLDSIGRYYKSIKFKKIKKNAWFIVWNYAYSEFHEDHIISIIDSRLGHKYIEKFVIHHYLAHKSTLEEKLHFSSRLKKYPYQVEYHKINGIRWTGSMSCGHNPFITACIVKNLTISYNDKGDQIIHWVDFEPTPPPL